MEGGGGGGGGGVFPLLAFWPGGFGVFGGRVLCNRVWRVLAAIRDVASVLECIGVLSNAPRAVCRVDNWRMLARFTALSEATDIAAMGRRVATSVRPQEYPAESAQGFGGQLDHFNDCSFRCQGDSLWCWSGW